MRIKIKTKQAIPHYKIFIHNIDEVSQTYLKRQRTKQKKNAFLRNKNN